VISQNAHRLLAQTFSSLRHPNYRLWFFGQLVSLMGTWMQSSVQGYLIYDLTRSTDYLGYIGLLGGLPSWIFTLYAGVVADRMPRRKLLVITQTYMMILAVLLTGLTFSGWIQPWHLLVMAFLLGIGNAFDAPVRLAFITDMVEDRSDLTNAIALNGTMFTAAAMVGPAVGGLVYGWVGPAWCFLVNALSFLAVIAALLLMRNLKQPLPVARQGKHVQDLKAGMQYTLNHPVIRQLVMNMGVVSVTVLGMITLLPAWAVQVLGGDASTHGFLLSARGIGSLLSALALAGLGRYQRRGRLYTLSSLSLPLLLGLFAFQKTLPLALLAMMTMGFAFLMHNNSANVLVQKEVADSMRGRVMSIYTMVFFGGQPLGAPLAGWLAGAIGEPATVQVLALFLLVYMAWVAWRVPQLRQME
jgi:MFS family permease